MVYAGRTRLPYGQLPVCLGGGEVSCQTGSGRISAVRVEPICFELDYRLLSPQSQAMMRLVIGW